MNIKSLARKLLPARLTDIAARVYRYVRGVTLYYAMGMHKYTHVNLIGVTGTNGKTTTTSYVNSILKNAGYTTALNTTVNTEIEGVYERNKSHLTSGTTRAIYQFIKDAADAGVDYIIMEVTSQTLHQHRHYGLAYKAAAITNLTYEHMEYHKTMDAYARAKAMLFESPSLEVAILNRDDEWHDFFSSLDYSNTCRKLSYGTDPSSDVVMKSIKTEVRGSTWTVNLPENKKPLKLNTGIVGMFNVYNATTAAVLCSALGVSNDDIANGVKALDWIDGRMNYIDEGQDFAVFTDYSHTPDGLTQVLETLRGMTKGNLILLQSAMDGRDPDKWPLLGEVAAKYADHIYVCDEEAFKLPREVMREAIISGIKSGGGEEKYTEIEDRQEAIETAVGSAKKGDIVIIVPFGHQKEMTFYRKTVYWDEREVAANAIRKKLGKKPKKTRVGEVIS